MLTWLKQYLTSPDQYLENRQRLVTITQAIVWIGTGMEIHNPLKKATR